MEFIKLETGKLIDAQVGFVESWNRMVDCWNNLGGEGKATIKWPTDRNPTVSVYVNEGDEDGDDDSDDDTDDTDDIPEIVLPPFDPRRPSGMKEYIAGDDTNIVFTEVTDESDPDYGKIKVDVYYS